MLKTIIKTMHNTPDINGYYGPFGGAYIPEMLYPNVEELRNNYLRIIESPDFKEEFEALLKDYVGRPTPLFLAGNLSDELGAKIYLKREDLCHTGAHKLNNVVGQALLAKRLGKKRIIAETGAGQHGVASATVCALLRLPCTVFMGSKDIQRQQPNVMRMKLLGAEVIPVESGSKTLKDATNEAIRHWINNPEDTHYLIGSTIGPHPYPDLVSRLQSVISKEIMQQLVDKEGREWPDYVLACAGGGSNAAGAFFHFIGNEKTKLIGLEAAGEGIDSGKTAATIARGTHGIIHGCKTLLMQTNDGQVMEAHSVSAGLDYPGIGPLHSYLHESKLATYMPITDEDALQSAEKLALAEGIIPALETAHAIAALYKLNFKKSDIVVVCLSGRGDKDLETYQNYFQKI
jgi:tryptophan synthase beta chain